MNPHLICRAHLRSVSIAALLSLSAGAQAVCLNADNSLDDGSMYTLHAELSLLPRCKPDLDAKNEIPVSAQAGYLRAQPQPAKAMPELKKSVHDKKPPARGNES